MAANDNAKLHSDLSRWIKLHGGTVHENNLALHTPPSSAKDIDDGCHNDHQLLSTNYTHRGIFAKGPITMGEEMIRLPASLALDGHELPVTYHQDGDTSSPSTSTQPKNASNWLRCISSLMNTLHQLLEKEDTKSKSNSTVAPEEGKESQSEVDYAPYIKSLPKQYDSLLNWTTVEIQSYLAGTALGVNALHAEDDTKNNNDPATSTNAISQSQHDAALRCRYRKTVIPYLKHLQSIGMFLSDNSDSKINSYERETKRQKTSPEEQNDIFEELYPIFRQGCMCISTRAFHMSSHNDSGGAATTVSSDYDGPYLLPYIDLLNHAPLSSAKHVTTLRRDPTDKSFVMIAERDISVGEEICHSYDVADTVDATRKQSESSSFTSAQLLQTFGFVDVDQSGRRIVDFFLDDRDKCNDNNTLPNPTDGAVYLGHNITPAVLTKDEICDACRELSRSTYITELHNLMERSGMLDEGWQYWDLPTMSSNGNDPRAKAMDNLPSELIVSSERSLTDELITICCLNFLPDDTLNELLEDEDTVLLNDEVLEDFFLGKLVLQAIINAVKLKLKSYEVVVDCSGLTGEDTIFPILPALREAYSSRSASLCWGKNEVADARALSKLIASNSQHLPGVDKFLYGLIVSLEERASLIQLRKRACDLIVQI